VGPSWSISAWEHKRQKARNGREELCRSRSRIGNLQRLELDFNGDVIQGLMLPGLVQRFENNFSLTDVYIDGIEDGDEAEEAMMKIAQYTTRSKVSTFRNPQTAMAIVTGIIPSLLVNCPEPESGLTVVYETLLNRAAADWNSDYGTQPNKMLVNVGRASTYSSR